MIIHQRKGPNDGLNGLIRDHLCKKSGLIGIEIGSYCGESTDMFIKSNAFARLYCIDPWISGYDPNEPIANEDLPKSEKEFDEKFSKNMTVVKLRLLSDDAVKLFDDLSIDFIYIDANHQYDQVYKDITNYLPKVKHGGVISGHDYGDWLPAVIKAVNDVFKVIPSYRYPDGSWAYIKA